MPFANSEELGEAWHSISGYGKQLHDPTRVETLLRGNPFFLERVFISDDRLFFGPARELLLTEAKRMAPPWSVANHHRFPAAARAYAVELLHIGCLLAWRRSPCGAGVGGGGEGVELEGGAGEGKGGGGGGTNHLPQVPVEVWLEYVMPLAVVR